MPRPTPSEGVAKAIRAMPANENAALTSEIPLGLRPIDMATAPRTRPTGRLTRREYSPVPAEGFWADFSASSPSANGMRVRGLPVLCLRTVHGTRLPTPALDASPRATASTARSTRQRGYASRLGAPGGAGPVAARSQGRSVAATSAVRPISRGQAACYGRGFLGRYSANRLPQTPPRPYRGPNSGRGSELMYPYWSVSGAHRVCPSERACRGGEHWETGGRPLHAGRHAGHHGGLTQGHSI